MVFPTWCSVGSFEWSLIPRVFNPPSDLASAIAFTQGFRSQPNAVQVTPGPRHWDIFKSLSEAANVKGNLVPDAYLAALAIEFGQRVDHDRP